MNPNLKKLTGILFAVLLFLTGMAIRYSGLNFISMDMSGFFINWYDELATGGFTALRKPFGIYTPPYPYLLGIAAITQPFLPKTAAIKIFPLLFDLCNVFLAYKILKIKYPQGTMALLGAASFTLLPTVILNSAFWGQPDAIFTSFLLACLYCLMKDRPLPAMIFMGISFAFKIQAVFFAPLLLLLTVRKRIPWLYYGIIPAVYILMMTPAMLAGRSFPDLMTIYFGQANEDNMLTLSAPNPYVFIPNSLYTLMVPLGIFITVLFICTWTALYAYKVKQFNPKNVLLCALISAAIVPFLLPKMHDRYFYVADVLSLLAAFYFPHLWSLALGYQIVSGMAYSIFLFIPPEYPVRDTILTVAAMVNVLVMGLALREQWKIISMDDSQDALRESSDSAGNIFMLIKSIGSVANDMVSRLAAFTVRFRTPLLFILILIIGMSVRMWGFGALPPGLNVDEASIGVEAYDLYKFGVDRNGMSYPVHFISWGSGQNAPYAYLLIPFIVMGGLNAATIRLPMMLIGIISLPLMYFVGKRMSGEKFGLLAMLFMAISPWHIINSRWAVESNLFPCVFMAGVATLLLSTQNNKWLIASYILFAACLYTYGTAYIGVPIFLALSIPIMLYTKRVATATVIMGVLAFLILALPIALFIAVNTFHLDTIHIGMVTIPRLPVQPRYEVMAAIFGDEPLRVIAENIKIMFNLLLTQADAFPWNYVEPFGYFYKLTFPLAAAGFLLLIPIFKLKQDNSPEGWLLFSWMIASIFIGIMHPVNLTRLNLIFIPILLCIAISLIELNKIIRHALPTAIFVLFVGFILFIQAYYGEEYQKRASGVFNDGIIPAIEFASENSDASICLTEQTYSAYIYVLFTQRMHPSEYIDRIEWIYPSDPTDPARTPRALGRYRFRIPDCENDPEAVYILTLKELPPNSDIEYKNKKFMKYKVHLPKIND